jgi:uncharacterized protein with HEPN domain
MQHDLIRLQHMLDAGKDALQFALGRERTDLESDRMLALALIKALEIIGEAASKVSENFKSEHPEIPWPEITGMRNRMIHAYYDVNLDVVWQTIKSDLPDLLKSIEKILKTDADIR